MKILVASDFSPEAIEAGRVAGDLARALNGSLQFIHVVEPETIYPLDSQGPAAAFDAARQAKAAEHLEAQAEAVGGNAASTSIRVGDAITVLTAEVTARKPDLVVVGACGARGKSSMRDYAESLALTLPCPVLVVRPVTDRMHFALANNRPMRIFLALDRSSASDQAIAWVRKLRAQLPCDVVVAHYYDPAAEHARLGIPEGDAPFTGHPGVVGALERELHERLACLGGSGALTIYCEPRVGLTAVELLGKARVANADMVVIGAHRRGKVARFLQGSVARDILRHCDVPVVCVGTPVTASPAGRHEART